MQQKSPATTTSDSEKIKELEKKLAEAIRVKSPADATGGKKKPASPAPNAASNAGDSEKINDLKKALTTMTGERDAAAEKAAEAAKEITKLKAQVTALTRERDAALVAVGSGGGVAVPVASVVDHSKCIPLKEPFKGSAKLMEHEEFKPIQDAFAKVRQAAKTAVEAQKRALADFKADKAALKAECGHTHDDFTDATECRKGCGHTHDDFTDDCDHSDWQAAVDAEKKALADFKAHHTGHSCTAHVVVDASAAAASLICAKCNDSLCEGDC